MLVEPWKKDTMLRLSPRCDKEEEIFEKMLEYYPNSKIIDVQNKQKQVLREISE